MTSKRILYNILYIAIVVGVILGAWAAAAAAIDSEFVLPSVSSTAAEFSRVLKSERFYDGLLGTLWRSTLGFLISLALFFVTFCFSTAYEPFRRIVEPLISALRSLPAVAVTLILALSVGGYGTPVVLGVLVIYPIMYSSARARTSTIATELKEVCVICGANKLQTFRSLWFPCLAGALPETLSTAFSYNIKAVIGAEILAQTADSLGMLMKLAQLYLEPAMLISYVIAAVAVSVIAEFVLRYVLKIVLHKYCDSN